MPSRNQGLALLFLAAPLLAAGCGAGVAGVVATSGGSSSGSAPPSIAAFAVKNTKEPERSTLNFNLSSPATVELLYQLAMGTPQRMTQVGTNPREFPAGPQDPIPWNFAKEPGLARSFQAGVLIWAGIPGVVEEARLGENALLLGMGNDAPEVIAIQPVAGEVSGIVGVEFHVEDSSDDVVSVRVEYDLVGDVPDAGFRLARPALDETTPEFGITDVRVDHLGTRLSFFWDTNVDLLDFERDVVLRFTAKDEVVEGASLSSDPPFRVDNNEEPFVQLFNDLALINQDERRGIPISFRVIDEEGDPVEMLFQWRRRDEVFPVLPADNAGLDALLKDPIQRAAHHVCTPYPHFAHGRVVPVDGDPTAVRLPELAAGESWILEIALAGQKLELLRPSNSPEPIRTPWPTNTLASPTAALPIGDGLTALILDSPDGAGRLREIELATGRVVPRNGRNVIATIPGAPTAMTFERGEAAVLIASNLSGVWSINRVLLAPGEVKELFASDGSKPGSVRGIASLGTNTAVFTASSDLLLVDYGEPLHVRVTTLLSNLETPFGVVLDPLNEGQIYLAERNKVTSTGTGRILAIDLDSLGKNPVVVKLTALQTLEQPEALALARNGTRLLALTSAPGGRQLVGLDLGGRDGNVPFAFGEPIPGSSTAIAAVASGPDGLVLIANSGADADVNELWVGGGLEQRRVIEAFDPQLQAGGPRRQLALLATPLEPPAHHGQPWRIPSGTRRKAEPTGLDSTFVWDSADARGGEVFLRALPRDDEPGISAFGAAPITVRAALEVEPLMLGDVGITNGPNSVATADLDADGDLDLVSANQIGSNLRIFFQESPGSFATSDPPLGSSSSTRGPVSVVAADLDGDGDQDLVSANRIGDNLRVFIQQNPPMQGTFVMSPQALGSSIFTNGPACVVAADLDGDGDQDLVCANADSDNLRIFVQGAPGSFVISDLALGSSSTTNQPVSVVAADVDGDGDLDLVSANKSGNNMRIFVQQDPPSPPGSFVISDLALGSSSITKGPVSVAAADLDDDGDLDLVSANSLSHNLTAFFQELPGSFATNPLTIGDSFTTIGARSVAVSDLDGDGDQDLISAQTSFLALFIQESPGSFVASLPVLGDSSATNDPVHVVATDIDGDGDQDLVSANAGGHNLAIFLHDSPGSPFQPKMDDLSSRDAASMAAADLDSDGDLDLVSTSTSNSSNLAFFFQESPGHFASPLLLSPGFRAFSVAPADLDGDGDLDLVTANTAGDNLSVFVQQDPPSPPGSFVLDLDALGTSETTDGPVSVVAADLDGDGALDLICASAGEGNVGGDNLTVFFQESPGSFVVSQLLGDSSTTDNPASIAAADLDGDGDLDLVSANELADNLTIFFQESSRVFATSSEEHGGFPLMDGPVAVVAADLDGDGNVDLVCANKDSDNLTVFYFQEPGGFPAVPNQVLPLPTGASPSSVAAADFDGDGDQDLACANAGDDTLTVFFQESPGIFATSHQILQGQGRPVAVIAADLDGDGDQDLACATLFGGYLRVYWGGR